MPGRTMRDAAEAADAERYVGRERELAAAADLLDPSSPSRVLFVHGPGGIGKSATVRAIGRLARTEGFEVLALDARSLPDDLDRRLDGVAGTTVVLVDELQALGSRVGSLRDQLLAVLPDTARLVLAGREGPDPSWREGGLDAIVADLPLDPLADADADRLLAVRGVAAARREDIVAWAQGSPLALTVAAAVPDQAPGQPASDALEARLTSWLAGQPMLDVPADVLDVAALAPVVDARLLAAALPGRSTRGAMAELVALPVVERLGDRAVLHTVLAAAIRARLEHRTPERARTLTRRIVEHLASRARLGDIDALMELSRFIADPGIRQAIANLPSATLYSDRPRSGELADFARRQGFDAGPDWAEVQRFADQHPDHSLTVRRRDGSNVLFAVFGLASALPDLGPVTASLRAAAEQTGADGDRTFSGVALFGEGTDEERAEAARLGSGALMHLNRMPDMQTVLLHYPVPDRRPLEALASIAGDLDHELPRAVVLTDFRPDGAVGFVERVVLGELGFPKPEGATIALFADDDDPVRIDELRRVLGQVFADTPADQRLRRAIELTHLGDRRPEQECLAELHVSRRTWYRLLRESRERVLAAQVLSVPD